MRTRPAIATAAIILLSACTPDRPEPSARLRRPSGLAYVERTTGATERADVFIADSEAQGVRVLQLEKRFDANGQEVFDTEFLASPVVFFPLVIPAAGFPTRIALSEDAARAYVLSPLSRQLHVLDARELPIGASPGDEGAKVILNPPLSLEDATAGALLPVAISIVPGFGSSDVVLIAFDAIDRSEGLVKAFRFDVSGATLTLVDGATESIAVATAPRDMVVRDQLVVTTSALTNSVSVIALNIAAPIFGSVTAIDAGGPTSGIIDAGPVGVIATRLDRPSVIMFDSTAGTLARSTRRFYTPYMTEEDRTSSAALGRTDLLDSNVVTGAYGRLQAFDINTDEDIFFDILGPYREPNGTADVIALAHLNGRMSFLFGPNAELALIERAGISRVTQFEGDVYVPECATGTAAASCRATDAPDPMCPPELIIADTTQNQVVRATYRGALAYAKTAALEFGGNLAPGLTLRLTDILVEAPFSDRFVRLGDQALLSLEMPVDCGDTNGDYLDHVVTGTISAIDGNTIDIEVRTSSATARRNCVSLWRLFSFEVYPSTDEVVIVEEGLGLEIQTVLDRVAVVRNGGVDAASITRIVRATMESRTGFVCEDEILETQPCLLGTDCTDSSACVANNLCLARCNSEECPPAAAGCTTQHPVRRCSSIEISVTRTGPYTLNLWEGHAFEVGAPDDAVFSTQRRSFLVSFPGAREIAEGFVDKGGTVGVSYIR